MRSILAIHDSPGAHWVGDGFPVRSLFSYTGLGRELSPFLMLDHAAAREFSPSAKPRGVGEHPHRGFETVSIVYQGELAHRDSVGNSGQIGPGDVQWMTAASGILHEEFHSEAFSKNGGTLEMVQLWVNLPARDKMSPPGYQDLRAAAIPTVAVGQGGAQLRVIAGRHGDAQGPARTFTPIELWDLSLPQGASTDIELPEGHTAAVAVLRGRVRVNDQREAAAGQLVQFDREAGGFHLQGIEAAQVLVLGGEPIQEPIVGYGPFVMNTQLEIRQAVADFHAGKFGQIQ